MANDYANYNPKNAMIARLLQEGMSTAPVAHWSQGANRLAQALLGGVMMGQWEQERKRNAELLNSAPGLGPAQQPDATMPPPQMSGATQPTPAPRTPLGASGPPIMQAEGERMGIYEPTMPTGGAPPADVPMPRPGPLAREGMAPPPSYTAPQQPGAAPVATMPPQANPMAGGPRSTINIPPQVADYIRRLNATGDPELKKKAAALYLQYGAPEEFKFQVAGDNLYRTGSRTGQATLVADAQKAPDAVRIAQTVMANPQAYGYEGPNDPRLHRDIQYRISGLQTPGQSVRDKADTDSLTEAQGAYVTATRLAPAVSAAKDAIMKAPEGIMGPMTATWGRIAAGIGLPVPQGANEAQLLQSITTQIAPLYRLPGPVSNAEMSLYMQAAPQLGDTRAANLMKIELFERLRERSGQIMDVMRRNAGSPNLYAELSKLDTPIFSPEEKRTLEAAASGQAMPGGQPGGGWQTGPNGTRYRIKQQ